MPECHKCPENGKQSKKCLVCAGPPDTNHHGRSFVSIDSTDNPDAMVYGRCVDTDSGPQELEIPECCMDTIQKFIGILKDLSDIDLSLVVALLKSQTMVKWAEEHHTSKQAAYLRLVRMSTKHKELSVLFKEHKTRSKFKDSEV